MPTIYQIGSDGYWTGATREIGERDGVERGWTRYPVPTLEAGQYAAWTGQNWSAINRLPAKPTEAEQMEIRKEKLTEETKRAYSQATQPIGAQYPPEEREGWPEQVAAAQEVLAGGQNDLIDALRQPTGETAMGMAQAIIAKRQEYLMAYGQVTAARRRLSAQIEAATTLADLDAIDVNAAFGLD